MCDYTADGGGIGQLLHDIVVESGCVDSLAFRTTIQYTPIWTRLAQAMALKNRVMDIDVGYLLHRRPDHADFYKLLQNIHLMSSFKWYVIEYEADYERLLDALPRAVNMRKLHVSIDKYWNHDAPRLAVAVQRIRDKCVEMGVALVVVDGRQ